MHPFLNNFEIVATSLIAFFVFREKLSTAIPTVRSRDTTTVM